jgi:hypothetical protein
MQPSTNTSMALAAIQRDLDHDKQMLMEKDNVIRSKDLKKRTLETSMAPKIKEKNRKLEEAKKITADAARIEAEIAQIESQIKIVEEEKVRETDAKRKIEMDLLRKQGELKSAMMQYTKESKLGEMRRK